MGGFEWVDVEVDEEKGMEEGVFGRVGVGEYVEEE